MPRKPAPLAKLLRPQLHRPVERERLFRLVDQRTLHPVLWVCGPPGCGKTTLVASYVASRKIRAVWYRVDEGDRDPAAFFAYLNVLARELGGPTAQDLPALTPEFFPDLPAFTRRCFRELFARLSRRSMLVLDNCHAAASDTFHLLLRCACQELPPGVSLVAISRGRRPRELTQLIASRSLLEIDWDDLRFQPDEAIALGRGLGVRDQQVVADYLARCNGWAAGLVLLAASRGRSTAAERDRFHANSDIFEYFATELLADMPQTQRSTLLATALLPQMTAATACELTGNSRAGELLESLHRQQYFTDRMGGDEPVYRYHDLFRDFLLARLASSTGPTELCRLRSRAGHLLEVREQLGEAIQLYRLSEQWPDVARLIRARAESLLDQGQWRTLNDWFEGLPNDSLEADPWLLYWRAQGLLTLDVVLARQMVRRAYQHFLREHDSIGQVYAIGSLIDLHWLVGELADHALNAAFLETLERHLSHPAVLTRAAEYRAWDALAQIILWGGCRSPFMEAAADALEGYLYDELSPWSQRIVAPLMSLVYAIAAADQERGQRISRAIAPHLEEPACSPVSRMWAAKLLGRWHFHAGEWDRAAHFAAQCQTLALRCKHPTQFVDAGWTRISALCVSGRHQEARALLESILLDQGSTQPYSMGLKHKAQSLLLAHIGAFDRAIPHQLQAIGLIAGVGCEWFVAEGHMLIAVYQISLDQLEEGRRSLQTAEALFARTHCQYQEALLHLANAELSFRCGDIGEGSNRLGLCLAEARNPVKAAALLWAGWWLPKIFATALSHRIAPELVCDLIQRFDIPADCPSNGCWPWRIRIQALGRFRVLVDDHALPTEGRPNFKLLQFLKAIVAAGGREVSTATLTEWLWPDSEGDAAQNNLKVSLHRLRKLLSREDAVTLHDGKVSLNPRLCWLDTWAFAAAAPVGTSLAEARARRLSLYRGHLLRDDSHPWVLQERERLRARFHHDALVEGEDLARRNAWPEGIETFRAMIETDPMFEPFYLRLMKCLEQAGRHGEALEVYHRCERTLRQLLGIRPSHETESAYRAMRSEPREAAQ